MTVLKLFFTGLSLVAATALLGGCGDGGTDTAATPENPKKSPPATLAIGGAPPTSALQGRVYAFSPTSSGKVGAALTFSARNLPPWAEVDGATGRLSGIPAASDIGVAHNITIDVSDGGSTASLGPFAIDVVATASGSATLMWLPPIQNSDGSALLDLAGYRVHFGTEVGDYPNVLHVNDPGLAAFVVEQLTPATWFFAISAVNQIGTESAHSNIGTKVVD